MIYGWIGKILRIDLSSGKNYEIPTMNYASSFLGGRGINAKIHWDEVSPNSSAFAAENVFSIMTGPTTGTFAPQSGKCEAGGKSPQTFPSEVYTRSGIGGRFGPYLKFAGYDGLIIEGKSPKRIWIYIEDGNIEIRDADHLWGLTTNEVSRTIWSDTDKSRKPAVLSIGPSGERLSRISSIIHDTGSAFGQGGFGGVWGSKNLKALAVYGTGSVEVANPDELIEISEYMRNLLFQPSERPPKITLHGYHRLNNLLEYGSKGIEWTEKYSKKAEACFGCPVGCRTNAAISEEQMYTGQAQCAQLLWYAMPDVTHHKQLTESFWKAAKLADALGVNSWELEIMVDWLPKLKDSGIITSKETGIPFEKLGEYEFAETLVNMIAYRTGFGDLLSEGISRAAYTLGPESQKYLKNHHRGFANQFDPRLLPVFALKLAMESRLPNEHDFYFLVTRNLVEYSRYGWLTPQELVDIVKDIWGEYGVKAIDRTDIGMYSEGHAYVAKWVQDYACVKKSMILCDWFFGNYASWYGENHRGCTPDIEPKLFRSVTGSDLMPDVESMLKIGERIYNLERAIMIREGRTRLQDNIPEYYFNEEIYGRITDVNGNIDITKRSLDKERFENLKNKYYEFRGWNPETGKPNKNKFDDLDLNFVSSIL
jgi:aldehyde:ferredoxin oxidoreductase